MHLLLLIISLWSTRFTWYSTEFIITIYPVIMAMISYMLKKAFHICVEWRRRRKQTPHETIPYDYNANNSKSRLSLLNKWNQSKYRSSPFSLSIPHFALFVETYATEQCSVNTDRQRERVRSSRIGASALTSHTVYHEPSCKMYQQQSQQQNKCGW